MARLLWLDREACKRHQEDAEAVDPYGNDCLSKERCTGRGCETIGPCEWILLSFTDLEGGDKKSILRGRGVDLARSIIWRGLKKSDRPLDLI